MSSRSRQRRKRFISGSTLDETSSCRAKKMLISTVHHSKSQCNEQHTSLPSSPNSPFLDSANMLFHNSDIGLGTYVSRKDIPVDRSDPVEDENSFSSSMFSEKLVQPGLNLVPEPSSTNEHDSVSHKNSSVPNKSLLNSRPSTILDAESDINLDRMLIRSERMVLTPTPVATDDPGSSEGEYENESRESTLHQTNPSVRHTTTRNMTNQSGLANVPSNRTLELVESESQGSIYSDPVKVSVFDTISQSTECSSTRSGSLSALNSTLTKPSGFVESSTPNCFVALVNCSPPLQILSSQKMHKTVSCHRTTTCFSESSVLPNMENIEYHDSSGSNGMIVTCGSHCSHRSTDGSPYKKEAESIKQNPCNFEKQPHDFHPTINVNDFSREAQHKILLRSESLSSSVSLSNNNFLHDKFQLTQKSDDISSFPPDHIFIITIPNSSEVSPTFVKKCRDSGSGFDTPMSHNVNNIPSPEVGHSYPLRSRLRQASLRLQWQAMQVAPKSFGQLPTEVVFRIIQYLSVQDVFRLQRVNHRFKSIIEQYLLLVKRINFSNGLPFAFLPDSITDVALKRMLSRTPEVTHILGFYPRKIAESYPSDGQYSNIGSGHNALTYGGIITAFRLCPKLRSVELMDVELMSELVRHLPRIKFHGMFRNRPDSWDCEYAVPLPPEPNAESIPMDSDHDSMTSVPNSRDEFHVDSKSKPLFGSFISTLFCSATAVLAVGSSRGKRRNLTRLKSKNQTGCACSVQSLQSLNAAFSLPLCKNENSQPLTQMAAQSVHNVALRHTNFANWFEPIGELPLGQGSPSTVPHFLPSRLFTAFNGGPSFPPAHENIPNNSAPPMEQDCYSNAIESLRNIAVSHFLQPGLPPIEAELIAVAPFGYSRCSLHGVGSGRNSIRNAHGPVLAFAFGAIFVPPQAVSPFILPSNNASNCRFIDARQYNAVILGANLLRGAQGPHLAFERILNFPQNVNQNNAPRQVQLHDQVGGRNQQRQHPQRFRRPRTSITSLNASGPWLVSPFPSQLQWIILPHAITNLTKLDLVSVAISAIPRLDNIKYLHLKWVVFASADPFFSFLAPKLQSFVMNNCSTPSRVVRFVRIFSALSRAPQLTRLELVGTRFIDGLIGHIIDDNMSHGRGFRNLQRLVLSSNKDASEVDIGLLLLAGQQSLNQVALQMLHTRNSLFEGLYHAGAEFPRLESLTLGYLDPYQSRLTVSELMSLGIGESSDHLSPICMITDWGMALAFFICPRLVNIIIRNAPYLNDITRWFSAGFCDEESLHIRPTIIPSASEDSTQPTADCQENSTQTCVTDKISKTYFLPLRSLTLENCSGISIENLERVLISGHPFPCLETVVLRNMFTPQYGENKGFMSTPHLFVDQHDQSVTEQCIDWRKLVHLLCLSDLLSTCRLGYSPLSPEDCIGLGASAREVIHMNPPRGFLPDSLRTKPHDLFCSLRAHTYLNSLLELDGSCGRSMSAPTRVFKTLFSHNVHIPVSDGPERYPSKPDDDNDFMSRSTQTCICGVLEWDVTLRMSQSQLATDQKIVRSKLISPDNSKSNQNCLHVRIDTETNRNTVPSTSSQSGKTLLLRSPVNQNNAFTPITSQLQLGGSLSFHPFPPSVQHKNFYRMITMSEWNQLIVKMSTPFGLPCCQIIYPVTGSNECSGCASDSLLFSQGISNYQISAPCKLVKQSSHTATKWLARDACIDTSELRCFTLPKPQILNVLQPLNAIHSCLTSIHFEKVGISHINLCESPHLKNITLENCTELKAIIFDNHSSLVDCSNHQDNVNCKVIDRFPALRRIRIINCPKFAIYNFLSSVGKLYPTHNENISITYRPFGQYNTQVERALWDYCQHAHILISHDYKVWESERAMEDFHSTFDQLFREVISFSDMVIRRDLLPVYPHPMEYIQNSFYKRCELGFEWDFITDIPWVHEVCCSLLKNSEQHRSDQADQLYELLSEYQAASENLKIQRHGIHYHVQFRNVHSHIDMCNNDSSSMRDNDSLNYFLKRKPTSYINWPYSENNLLSTYPSDDLNAMKNILKENRPSFVQNMSSDNCSQATIIKDDNNIEFLPWKRLLLSQEEIFSAEFVNRDKSSSLASFPNNIKPLSKQNSLSHLSNVIMNKSFSTSDNRSKKFTPSSTSNFSSSPTSRQQSSSISSSAITTICDHSTLISSSRKRSLPPTKLFSNSCKKFKLKQ